MVQTLAISKQIISMAEVQARFQVVYTTDPDFFTEWRENLPELSDRDRIQLEHLQQRFLNHRDRGSLAEGTVDRLMISPLLDLAGLYDSAFSIQTEKSVEIEIQDRDEVLQGRIDTLILCDQIWILVIEAKNSAIAISVAIPQALTYLLAKPSPQAPLYAMVSNGEDFRFIKLVQTDAHIEFDLSDLLSIIPPSRSQLPQVLQVLKGLTEWAINPALSVGK